MKFLLIIEFIYNNTKNVSIKYIFLSLIIAIISIFYIKDTLIPNFSLN